MILSKKWLVTLALMVLVILTTACGNDDQPEANEEETNGQEDSAQEVHGDMPEPDLEDIPDVVAEVNGKEIGKEDFTVSYQTNFQQMAMQAQMTGQEVDEAQLKEQTVDIMINQELLEQKVNDSQYEASEEDIDLTLEDIASQNQLQSKDELLSALKEQGMDEEEVLAQIEMQVKLDHLIADELGDIQPTEEEIKSAYDQVVSQQEQTDEETEIPPLDDVRPDIEQQLISQKETEFIQNMVDDLRQGADITIHL